MKVFAFLAVIFALVSVPVAGGLLDLDGDDFEHDQSGQAGQVVSGSYRWVSPEGQEFVVRYVADEDGYRVVESNAVPVNVQGVRANGQQGDLHGDSNEFDD